MAIGMEDTPIMITVAFLSLLPIAKWSDQSLLTSAQGWKAHCSEVTSGEVLPLFHDEDEEAGGKPRITMEG